MTSEKNNAPESIDNPFDNIERYRLLIQMFDKNIERYGSSTSNLNQKATWTLATATGFAVITGLTTGNSIISAFNDGASNSDYLGLLLLLLFVLIYLALLQNVLNVYRPHTVEFPVTPLNISKLGTPISRYKDQGTYSDKCWDDIMIRFLDKDEVEFNRETLKSYIDTTIEWHILNEKMSRPLKSAFRQLPLLGLISLLIWLLT